jgi:hypothetical protein
MLAIKLPDHAETSRTAVYGVELFVIAEYHIENFIAESLETPFGFIKTFIKSGGYCFRLCLTYLSSKMSFNPFDYCPWLFCR